MPEVADSEKRMAVCTTDAGALPSNSAYHHIPRRKMAGVVYCKRIICVFATHHGIIYKEIHMKADLVGRVVLHHVIHECYNIHN